MDIIFNPGDKVTYTCPFGNEEGIIKSISNEDKKAFVVYKCGNDWDNYMNYTGNITEVLNLRMGWKLGDGYIKRIPDPPEQPLTFKSKPYIV